MPHFSSLPATQTHLENFLAFFQEIFRVFQENSLANSKKFQTLVCNFILYLAKHFLAKFQLSSFYPDGLRQIFDHFEENFRIFQENSLANSKKFQI
jgi:hypothetical protein